MAATPGDKTPRPAYRRRMTFSIWMGILLAILLFVRVCSMVVRYLVGPP